MTNRNQKASGLLPDGRVMKRWLIPGVVCGSCLGIGLSQPAISDNSAPIGQALPGELALSVSDIRELGGGILRSGLKAQKKEDVSYATLLQRQALIQIKLVDGQLAAVVLPGMACPGQ